MDASEELAERIAASAVTVEMILANIITPQAIAEGAFDIRDLEARLARA